MRVFDMENIYIKKITLLEQLIKKLSLNKENIPLINGANIYEIKKLFSKPIQPKLFKDATRKEVFSKYEKIKEKRTSKTAIIRNLKRQTSLEESVLKKIIEKEISENINEKNIQKLDYFNSLSDEEISQIFNKTKEIENKNEKINNRIEVINKKIRNIKKEEFEFLIVSKKEVVVKINFRGLEGVRFSNIFQGPLSSFKNILSKEEVLIALRNHRIEIIKGDIEAIENIEFTKYPEKRRKAHCSCGSHLDYNMIGVNKKLGVKDNTQYKCKKCLGISESDYYNIISNYKRSGCNLFI